MRVLFFSDSHLAERPPASRNPTYAEDVFAKLAEVKEIAAICDISIFGGDLYHAAHPPHAIVRRTIELLRDWPCPLYIVVGNHDLPADGMVGLDRVALGVVIEAVKDGDDPRIELLDGDVLESDADDDGTVVQLSAAHWTPSRDADPDYRMGEDIDPATINRAGAKHVRIKIAHSMIMADGAEHPFPCLQADEIETDADIILCGHTHWQTGPVINKNGVVIVGPGSIARTQNKETERRRQIQVLTLNIDGKAVRESRGAADAKRDPFNLRMIPLKSARPASEIFHAIEPDNRSVKSELLEGYVSALELGLNVDGGASLEDAIAMMERRAPKGVAECAMTYLRDAGL